MLMGQWYIFIVRNNALMFGFYSVATESAVTK